MLVRIKGEFAGGKCEVLEGVGGFFTIRQFKVFIVVGAERLGILEVVGKVVEMSLLRHEKLNICTVK